MLVVLARIPKACSECVEIDNFYVALQPAGSMTATEGDNLHFVCSTNLPANYARWEINDVKFPDNLPPGFSASGFTIEFSIEETVQIRCFIRVSISGSLADVCSNTATAALEGVPLQSHGNTDNTQTVSNATSGGNLIQASVWQTLTNSSIPSSSTLIKSIGAPTVTAGSTSAVPASLPGNSSLKTFKVLTAATSSVVLVVSIIAAVTLWIYRHQHKKKGQKLDKEYHVYEEVSCELSTNHCNPATKINLEDNPAYMSTKKPSLPPAEPALDGTTYK
ncbi:hypothetical protein GBAR_LOCUS8496 [Geodia barretti]|uniref:Uncharacterized protein n=1 Tax=Geodia barretti TaxID=519541 RepID=A0AA35RKT7_GEOBA|nr:hypothetical protein GBAR_LOCUS8496 [Geodia barretti]